MTKIMGRPRSIHCALRILDILGGYVVLNGRTLAVYDCECLDPTTTDVAISRERGIILSV